MGMFDEIRCEAPLPDEFDSRDVLFQTKSIPDPMMCRYVINARGRLVDEHDNDLEPEGYITFYTDVKTETGRIWYEYRAEFQHGQLKEIVRVPDVEIGNRRYVGLSSFRWFNTPSHLFDD